MDAKSIEQIPCPLCKAIIRSQQCFVRQYMELCEHCKNKFALKFCVCNKTAPADLRQEKYDYSDHKERHASRDRRGTHKGWIKLSPEQKLLEKDKIFFKNMYDFFRHFPPCSREVPKYNIKPLIDDRLYGNVDDFFKKINSSPSYASVHAPHRHHDYYSSERDESETDRPVADGNVKVSEQHERQHKYYSGPEKDEHRQVVETRERIHFRDGSADDYHRVLETTERRYEHFKGKPGDLQRVSEKHERHRRYYSGPLAVDDRRSISERPSEYSGTGRDRPHRLLETHESTHVRYYGEPLMDDYGRVRSAESSADRRPGAAKSFGKQYELYSGADMDERPSVERHRRQYRDPTLEDPYPKRSAGPSGTGPLAAQTVPDINEERKGGRTQKGYASEPDTMADSFSKASGRTRKGTRKEDDDLVMVHERGTFKYAEKSPEVEKFKEYMEQVRDQQKQEKEQKDSKWLLATSDNKKPGLKSKIKKNHKGGKKGKSEGKQGSGDEKEAKIENDEKKERKVSEDTDEVLLKILQSTEGIVPITETALHLGDLDKRTSENQAKMIGERLNELALKRRKPIIVEFIKRKKKTPRIRQGARGYLSRLNSMRSLTERSRKENMKPEKISELDILNITSSEGLESIIIGPKLYHYKPPLKESAEPNVYDPLLHTVMPVVTSKLQLMPFPEPPRKGKKGKATEEPPEVKDPEKRTEWNESPPPTEDMSTDGIISYALSDRRFIEKGWSKLPTEHIVRKMNVYRMRPKHPEANWFERNKCKKRMHFESGERFAEFNNEEGRCQIFYKNGKIALDHYKSEEPLIQKRIVIYSKADPCSVNQAQSILAIFDDLGNGVVFDHKGKTRLKYNQTEGLVLDKSLGPFCHWEWHSLNDPPELKHIMTDTNLIFKDQDIFKMEDQHNVPKRPVDEAVHAIELDNIVKEKKKKMKLSYKRFPIRIKSVKINNQFTLIIIDQASIYIKFKEGSTFFKTNIGLILDQNEIVDNVTEKLGAVMNSIERRPAPTESLMALQRTVLKTQRDEERWKLRDRKINRLADPNEELDKKMKLLSKPVRKVPSPRQISYFTYL